MMVLFCGCFYNGMVLVSGLLFMIIVQVCIFVLWIRFFNLCVVWQMVCMFGLVLIRLWILVVFLYCLWLGLVILDSGMFLVMIVGGNVLVIWLVMVNLGCLQWICVEFFSVVLVLMVLKVMICVIWLWFYLLVVQCIILLWCWLLKLILMLGIEVCLGLRNCLNSRLCGIGLMLVMFSVQVISELVVELWLGFIFMFVDCVQLIRLVMIRKYDGKFLEQMMLILQVVCLWYLFGGLVGNCW